MISRISETLPEQALNESIENACNDITRVQSEHADYANMGTTLVIAQKQKRAFNIAWVGDSRLYCYDESLRLLTHDHSFVQELIDRGVLTKPQARRHEKRNLITNFIGLQGERTTVAYKKFKPVKSGTLLLCSDGVTDYVTEGQLAIIMASTTDNEARAEQLVSCVFDTPAADNLSFIFVSYNVSLGLKLLNRVT